MKDRVKNLIKILGFGLNELIIEISIGEIIFDSIELDELNDLIILHKFEDDFDFEYDFEDLEIEKQKLIYKKLSIVYN